MVGDREHFLTSLDDSTVQTQPGRGDDFQVNSWLGMELMAFTPDVARALGTKQVDGVYVRRVVPGSPADNASIARGTVILQVGSRTVKDLSDIDSVRQTSPKATDRIPLIVVEPDGTIARKVIRP